MVFRINIAFLAAVLLSWAALTPAAPRDLSEGLEGGLGDLAALEDSVARRPTALTVRELGARYLELDRPDLALSVAQAEGGRWVQADLRVLHLLARAYEKSGRMGDAVATAELARIRCARRLGVVEVMPLTPVRAAECSVRDLALFEMHAEALEMMFAWGVSDPAHDPRAAQAYALTTRTARIASAE